VSDPEAPRILRELIANLRAAVEQLQRDLLVEPNRGRRAEIVETIDRHRDMIEMNSTALRDYYGIDPDDTHPDDARDAVIYQMVMDRKPRKEIAVEMKNRGWKVLTAGAYLDRATAYAVRHKKPLPPRLPRGRRKSQ
jgi:hypothetical protein